MVDESAGIKISLTALQVSIRWFRRAMSGFCVQTVGCLPASAGLLHGVVVCMALYMSALALDQRAVLSRPTVTLAQYVRRTCKRTRLTTYIASFDFSQVPMEWFGHAKGTFITKCLQI